MNPVDIHLDAPFRIAGVQASRLAVALLLSVVHAYHRKQAATTEAIQIAGLTAGAYPMALSRAFKLFSKAGIEVGWGPDQTVPVSSLSVRGRLNGPFWIGDKQVQRLNFYSKNQLIHHEEFGEFLSLGAISELREKNLPDDTLDKPANDETALVQRLSAWSQLLALRQTAEEGRLNMKAAAKGYLQIVEEGSNAQDDSLYSKPFLVWAMLLKARFNRLGSEIAQARLEYQQIIKSAPKNGPRTKITHAMAQIGMAWCDHQENKNASAMRRLIELSPEFDNRYTGNLWLNSRLASEYFNLRALVRRTRLLSEKETPPSSEAILVLNDLEKALECAVESDSLTLMEAISSNLGYSIWLLNTALEPRIHSKESRKQAIRWILVGEALCQRHGLSSGSFWNIIYICRISRDAKISHRHSNNYPPSQHTPSKDSHSIQALFSNLVTLKDLRDEIFGIDGSQNIAQRQIAELFDLLIPHSLDSWLTLTRRMLENLISEDHESATLQTCAAMLEYLWQLIFEGLYEDALKAEENLRMAAGKLPLTQKQYFMDELTLMSSFWESTRH